MVCLAVRLCAAGPFVHVFASSRPRSCRGLFHFVIVHADSTKPICVETAAHLTASLLLAAGASLFFEIMPV